MEETKKIGVLSVLNETGISYFRLATGKWSMPFAYAPDEVQSTKIYEIRDSLINFVIAEVEIMTLKDVREKFHILYNKFVMAMRPRPDGTIGIESFSGLDTRLSESKLDDPAANVHKIRFGFVPERTTKDEAHWNTKDSKFIMEEKK